MAPPETVETIEVIYRHPDGYAGTFVICDGRAYRVPLRIGEAIAARIAEHGNRPLGELGPALEKMARENDPWIVA